MWYVTDSADILGALQNAELVTLVTNLTAFQDVIRGEKLQSRVTRQSSATILTELLKRKIKVNKEQLTAEELKKGDKVILLLPLEVKNQTTIGLVMALM